jgi:transposase
MNAAAIDVGARELWVAVAAGRDEQTVRVLDTFTDDLQQRVQGLIQCGITTVAMESTGVYFALSSALIGRVQVPPALG